MHLLGLWPAIHIFRVEKYRPDKLDDLISHQDIINTSKSNDLFYLSSPQRNGKMFVIDRGGDLSDSNRTA